MTKLLERAIERMRELPAQDQDALASALLALTGEPISAVSLDSVVSPDDDTRAAIAEGLAEAKRGDLVSEHIRDARRRPPQDRELA